MANPPEVFPLSESPTADLELERLLIQATEFFRNGSSARPVRIAIQPPSPPEWSQAAIPLSQAAIHMSRIKADLNERHNRWLAENDTAQLYGHVTQAWRIERILDFTREIRGRILDLGCFDGFISEKVQQQGGKEVIGVDRLEKGLERTAARGIETRLVDLDDVALDFPDHHFDCVLAAGVLSNLYDPDAVVEETRRVLKPGGKLIATVPNLASLANRTLLLLGSPPYSLEVRPSEGGYWRYFTFGTLHKVLRDHGFQIKSMESNCVAYPLIYLSFSRWPVLRKLFAHKPPWKRHRLLFSRSLARMLPELGEQIVALAVREA